MTALYFVFRKLISWAIDDDVKFHKKQGHLGPTKESAKNRKQLAYDKLTGGYAVVIFVLVLYIIKLIVDAN
ncbi:MAG: hypothetical protein IKA02_03215 [Clostridia bacterium]|nr:hypothetical protein [Clostridia bacterium]